MATFKFNLKYGLKVGEERLRNVVMKDHLTAEEILEASEAAEKIVMVGEGNDQEPQFVISPTKMAAETLRRQIASIGDIQGPISMHQLNGLRDEDLAMLNRAAAKIENVKVSQELARRGRSDSAT